MNDLRKQNNSSLYIQTSSNSLSTRKKSHNSSIIELSENPLNETVFNNTK